MPPQMDLQKKESHSGESRWETVEPQAKECDGLKGLEV